MRKWRHSKRITLVNTSVFQTAGAATQSITEMPTAAERASLEEASRYAGSQTPWTPENAQDIGLDPNKGFSGAPIAEPATEKAYSPPADFKPVGKAEKTTEPKPEPKPADSTIEKAYTPPSDYKPTDKVETTEPKPPTTEAKPADSIVEKGYTPPTSFKPVAAEAQQQQVQPEPTTTEALDPHAQQRSLVDQGHTPGYAQAIVAGQEPKTISGEPPKTTEEPKAVVQPTPPPAEKPEVAPEGDVIEPTKLYHTPEGDVTTPDWVVPSTGQKASSYPSTVRGGQEESPVKRTQQEPVEPLKSPTPLDPKTTRTWRATWFGRNPDGSPDTTDEKTMSYYNAHHGAWGADLLDKNLVGVAVSPQFLRANGVDVKKSPGSQGYKMRVTSPNGQTMVVDIVDLGPQNTIDMTYGLGKALGLKDNSQLSFELLDHQGKAVTLGDEGRGGGGGKAVAGGGGGGKPSLEGQPLGTIPTPGGTPQLPQEPAKGGAWAGDTGSIPQPQTAQATQSVGGISFFPTFGGGGGKTKAKQAAPEEEEEEEDPMVT